MAKDPARRPADAGALLHELAQLSIDSERVEEVARISAAGSSIGAEQRLVSVVMAAPSAQLADAVTLDPDGAEKQKTRFESLRAALAELGAHLEPLADGSLVATLIQERSAATDQAAQGARCAALLRERWPEAAIALTTGRGVWNERLPIGEALERAGELLLRSRAAAGRPPSSDAILLDEVTAGLIAARFPVRQADGGHFLLPHEEVSVDASRPLLGKPTPCVGREQELGILDAALHKCVEDGQSQALLVTAPPGLGKSRLLHGFRRLTRKTARPTRTHMTRTSSGARICRASGWGTGWGLEPPRSLFTGERQ